MEEQKSGALLEKAARSFPFCVGAESARGISPRAPHRSVLDGLPSHGSCHPRELPPSTETGGLLLFPVGPLWFQRGWPTPFAPRTLLRFITATRWSAT